MADPAGDSQPPERRHGVYLLRRTPRQGTSAGRRSFRRELRIFIAEESATEYIGPYRLPPVSTFIAPGRTWTPGGPWTCSPAGSPPNISRRRARHFGRKQRAVPLTTATATATIVRVWRPSHQAPS